MIMYEPPRFLRVPRFLVPIAKMVGNMMEMKKNTAMSAMTDTYSTAMNTTPVRITHTEPYAASSFAGAILVMMPVLTKRPISRQSMALDRKNAPCCAVPPGQHSMYRLMKNAPIPTCAAT